MDASGWERGTMLIGPLGVPTSGIWVNTEQGNWRSFRDDIRGWLSREGTGLVCGQVGCVDRLGVRTGWVSGQVGCSDRLGV